jgi:hypothetical protein
MCLENVGTINVIVVCDRSGLTEPAVVTVHYRTIADTAHEHSDFVPTEGVLRFDPEETKYVK